MMQSFGNHKLPLTINVLREVQSAGGEELSALLSSILDKGFKGEL
jgi:hypothetical protein